MKFLSILFSALILLTPRALFAEEALALNTDLQPYTINRIAAVVNGDVILVSELNTAVKKVVTQLEKNNTPIPDKIALQSQVLERLVIDALQMQIAERNGLDISDAILNEELQALAKESGVSLSKFRDILNNEGYSYATFRENIREKLVLQEVRRQMVANRISVNDQEIDNLLASLEASGLGDVKYRFSHIMVAIPEAPSSEQINSAKQRASNILMRLREGGDFVQIAIAESDGQNALEGGDLGWRTIGQLPSLFVETAKSIQPGEVSDLLRSPGGFHIVKLFEKTGDERHLVNQSRVRHILVKTDAVNTDDDVRRRLEQLEIRLRSGEDFATLARSNSQDTLSAVKGGELGWLGSGDTVPRFEAAMNRLALGEISKPVKSQFGWHLIQVLERREYDSTSEFERAKAKRLIQTRKYDEELLLWLRRLRDESYVEYRLKDS